MASMGFAAQAAKTYEQNRQMLRSGTFFKKLSQSLAIRKPSKIDGNRLMRKAIILARRKLNHRLRLALVFSLIYLAFAFSIALSI